MKSSATYLELHFIVLLFGCTAVLGRLISLPPVELVFFRTWLAAIGMGVLLLVRGQSLAVPRATALRLFLTGGIIALHWISFFMAARVSNVSVSLVGFATTSLWTALLDPMFKGVRIRMLELLFAAGVMAGLYIIFSADFSYHWGLALGVLSGLTSALFSIINSRFIKKMPSTLITFYEMGAVSLLLGLLFPLYVAYGAEDHLLHLSPTPADWIWLLVLAWVCTVFAYAAAVELMRKLSVFTIQLTMNMEPVWGIVLAFIVFGEAERMDIRFYIGTLIILCAVLLYPLAIKRFRPSQTSPEVQ